MNFIETKLKGCFILEPKVIEDSRGYFFESYHKQQLQAAVGYPVNFVQDNQSKSGFGVIRGLHIQRNEHPQTKLVRVLSGRILDIAVDVRKNSPTFGEYTSVELSAENKKQLFIPNGFLHGFSVLSESAEVFYKCDDFYHRDSEDGVHPFDQDLKIDWQIPADQILLSEKDKNAKSFAEFKSY